MIILVNMLSSILSSPAKAWKLTKKRTNLDVIPKTRLIVDVTIGHIYNSEHKYKRKNLQTMESWKPGSEANTHNIINDSD